jgi:hypothetical protein
MILLFKLSKIVLYIFIPFASIILIINLAYENTYLDEIIIIYTLLIIIPALILHIPIYLDSVDLKTTKISILLFKISAWLFPLILLLINSKILNLLQSKNFLFFILISIWFITLVASILSFYSFWVYKKIGSNAIY